MFSRMHTFVVYVKPEDKDPLEKAIFVREGFSPIAAIFHFFWALYHRIWWLASVSFVFTLGTYFFNKYGWISAQTDFLFHLGFLSLVGIQFQDWYGNDLRRRGYVLLGLVLGHSEEEAKQRFFDNYARRHRNLTTHPPAVPVT